MGVKPIVEWIKEDWPENQARVTQESSKEHAPLDFETWSAPNQRRRKRKYNHPFTRIPVVEAMTMGICGHESVITYQETKSPGMHENFAIFDGDARKVGTDNCASGCISDDQKDFMGKLRKVPRAIKGFGGQKAF